MLPRGHLHLTETLKYYQPGEPRITWPSIVATPVSRSVFADPARLISIILFAPMPVSSAVPITAFENSR